MKQQIPNVDIRIIKGFTKPENILKMSCVPIGNSGEKLYYKLEKQRVAKKHKFPEDWAMIAFEII